MQRNMEERAQELGNYIVEHRTTVRAAAARYRISKSTVHMVLSIGVGYIGCLSMRACEKWYRGILTEFHMSIGLPELPSTYNTMQFYKVP